MAASRPGNIRTMHVLSSGGEMISCSSFLFRTYEVLSAGNCSAVELQSALGTFKITSVCREQLTLRVVV